MLLEFQSVLVKGESISRDACTGGLSPQFPAEWAHYADVTATLATDMLDIVNFEQNFCTFLFVIVL